MYTGDDFNYAELSQGTKEGHSDALLGIFDAIAPAASAALSALTRGGQNEFFDILEPTVPLSRHIFKAPTRFYKTGVVFVAWLNGLQDHFVMVGGQESARSRAFCGVVPAGGQGAGAARPGTGGGADERVAGGAWSRVMAEVVDGLSINLATVRQQWDMAEAVEGCLRRGIKAIAPWRDQVERVGLAAAARLVRENGLRVTGLCRGGFFPGATAEERARAVEDNRRAVDEAAELGADCLVMVVGGLPAGSRDIGAAREMVRDGLAAMLPHARAAGVPVALEPLHPMYAADRACVNTLGQALDLCDELGEGTGVAIDVYHVWWDPELERQLARAGAGGRILAHHICDWLVPTRDPLNDRGMMGDGVVDLKRIRGWFEAAGFHGPQEVREIFSSENWWKRDGDEVLRTCVERFRTVC